MHHKNDRHQNLLPMRICKHTIIYIILTCLSAINTKAQTINWNLGPQKGFVYEISNKEAQKLLTISKADTIFKGLLHTVIDTFDIKIGWNDRPLKGHFILVSIHKNKIHCE